MKQIIQSLKTGETKLEEIPAPTVTKGAILIKTTHSLVSLGTEKMLIEFGRAGLLSKVRQQPEKVRQVIEKVKSEGLFSTIENVFKRLDEPLSLGYCNAGVVVQTGEGVTGFYPGDRVVSNGKHAEYVVVPQNLVAKIPDNVSQEEAVFTVIGSIGLQGIRLANPTFGEVFVVFGLGLIGLLTTQILQSNGCQVIGIDIDQGKCDMATRWGVKTFNPTCGIDPVKSVLDITSDIGADGVIITASAKTDEIISQAARMCRKRGRVILVGVVGLNINRSDFYEKELTFQVSCSYGPGRYDDHYEIKGQDYPLPFVRWTEKRNFNAILQAISNGQLRVKELITEVKDLDRYHEIYDNINKSNSIASILRYPSDPENLSLPVTIHESNSKPESISECVAGVIGSGNYTKMTLLPILNKTNITLKYIASAGGVSGTFLAKKFKISYSTTDYHHILNDPEVNTVFITTRHSSHSKIVVEALNAGKHVFVEKPLAINTSQLEHIESNLLAQGRSASKALVVGFNRRFSPHIGRIRKQLGINPGKMNIVATMNAGAIPRNSWIHDMETGGGRIIGEACHYIDLCVHLTNSEVISVCMNAMGENPDDNTDNASILLKFKNGSNAAINYFANGSKAYSKERIEVFSQGMVFVVDNFITTKAYGVKGFRRYNSRIDKGHRAQFQAFVTGIIKGEGQLIPINEIFNVTKASFAAVKSLREKRWVQINEV